MNHDFDCEETWVETGNAGTCSRCPFRLYGLAYSIARRGCSLESLGSAHEFVQFFATKKSEITKSAKKLLQSAAPGALVWVAYPKKTSSVDSDLSREEVWAAMEGTGWRPVSQIAIDDVWSALRFRPIQDVKSRK
jgi:hypothetical protein